MKLRYSEAFYSVQGEGKFVGVPSVFLRTFGCNFRCMNFGLKNEPMRDEKQKQGIIHNQEVADLIANDVTLNFVLDCIKGNTIPSKAEYAKRILETR